jgi:hypothetical protein
MTDLWPNDLGTVTTKSPVSILKEQASLLGARTKNLVKGAVAGAHNSLVGGFPNTFCYAFGIVGPALDNYTYRLFTIGYDENLYPVHFLLDDSVARELGVKREDGLVASDEQEFQQSLIRIFASQKSRQVIHAILSHSLDRAPEGNSLPDHSAVCSAFMAECRGER